MRCTLETIQKTEAVLDKLRNKSSEWDMLWGVLHATLATELPIDGILIAQRLDEIKNATPV